MSLKVHIRHAVTILELSGRFGLGDSEVLLRDAIQNALKAGARNLVLDLRHVTYMDSTGLGELASAQKLTRSRKCEFKLLHPPPRVEDLLQITGLAPTFDIYTDEATATTTLKP
jgi:anti-sigma B factor antagonist